MVSDFVKDLKKDIVSDAIEQFDLSRSNAEDFVENFPNKASWPDVEETAEALGIDITDVDDDDVENYMDMGGKAKGELESSSGLIQWIYDNKLKAYIVYMVLADTPMLYRLKPDMMREWKGSNSIGEYYNLYIRGNTSIEDPNISCGCGPNPCEQGQIDQFKAKYSSIS